MLGLALPAQNPVNSVSDRCAACTVRDRAICADLETDDLEQLGEMGRHSRLVPGQSLIWEGEDAPTVANVIEGVLKLWTSLPDGREQIIGIAYPSDFIGRPFSRRSSHNVTALTAARVCTFNSHEFDRFARKHPSVEHELLDRTLTELDRTRKWLLLLGRMSASERLANFLLDISERIGSPNSSYGSHVFELPFGRQQVADILGLTVETVSRQLTQFKQNGLIDIHGRRSIQLIDPDALKHLAEGFC